MPSNQSLSREDIIAAAGDLIVEQGLSALTMRALAKRLGCSLGTLPHYFKTKEELINETLDQTNERILSSLDQLRIEELTVDLLIPVLVSTLPLDAQSDREWRIRSCMRDYSLTQPVLKRRAFEVNAHLNDFLLTMFTDLQSRGIINRSFDAETISNTLFMLTLGVSLNMLQYPMTERQALLRPIIRYVDALRVPPRTE